MSVQQQIKAQGCALIPDKKPEVRLFIADAERWQSYARRVNEQAIAAGLATEEEVAQGRTAAEEALTRLRGRVG